MIRGYLWLVRRYGLRATVRFWRARRQHVVIDFDEILSRDELAVLGEHSDPAPWERS